MGFAHAQPHGPVIAIVISPNNAVIVDHKTKFDPSPVQKLIFHKGWYHCSAAGMIIRRLPFSRKYLALRLARHEGPYGPARRYIAARSRAPVLRFVRGLGDESGGDIMGGGRYTDMLLPFHIGSFKSRFHTLSTAL